MEAQLRVHTEYVDKAELLEWIKKRCTEYYVALEEDAERPHYQAYLKFDPKYANLNSIRTMFKKIVTGTGNTVYSLKGLKKPAEHLVCYLFKENKCVMSSVNKQLMDKAKTLEQDIHAKLEKRKSSSGKASIIDNLLDLFPPRARMYDQKEMVDKIVRWFHEEGRMQPDLYQLQKYLRTVCAHMDIDRYSRVVQQEIADKMSVVSMMYVAPESFAQDDEY